MKLEKTLGSSESKIQNNYPQSFGIYQQHQQNVPCFQNPPDTSNSISNFNPTNHYKGNKYDRFPSSNSKNNQFASTKTVTDQPVRTRNYLKLKI